MDATKRNLFHHLFKDNILEFCGDTIEAKLNGLKLPIKQKNGDMFVEWNIKEVLCTKAEKCRMNRKFFDPG